MSPSDSTDMVMKHSDPAMQKEHNQLESLVPKSAATHIASRSGAWFDPTTWQGGKIPAEGANVFINEGVTVTYDAKSDASLKTVAVEGQLKFATTKDTKMVVDTFVVSPSGRLEIGTEENPVRADVTTEILIADNGPLNLNWDPGQLSRGLISHGSVEIHGQAKTSHVKVAADPMAGDRALTLQNAPKNWQIGDRLVLTGTRYPSERNGDTWDSLTQDEEVVIESIKGNRITLDRALKFDHDTPRGDLKAYVANQSRNIVIATENADKVPTAQRGHAMFMHSDDVDIRYAAFRDLGRTDKTKPIDNFKDTGGTYPKRVLDGQGNPVPGARKNISGRYSAHLHRLGNDSKPAVLVGNAVDGSPGWGFVVHDSSAILEENVAYDVDGGAFVTESGNETGVMRNNISIKTGPGIDDVIEKQGTGTHDFARTGVGFWFQGRMVENEGNVAAGSRNAGMFYFHRGVDLKPADIDDLPVPALGRDVLPDGETVSTDQVPIQNFKNNEVLASGAGLHVIKDFPRQSNDLRTVLDGFKGWNVEKGAKFQYTSHYTLNDFDLIGSENPTAWKNQGLELQKNVQDFVFNNTTIDGFSDGIAAQPDVGQGPAALADRGLIWIDLKLKNNKTDLKGINIAPKDRLQQSDLTPGRLEFDVAADADFFVSGSEQGSYIDIRGTKTDSLGSVELPFGDERLSYNYRGAANLAEKGYYTLPDGTRASVIEEYIADRVTGEVKKYPFVVTFEEDWWTDGAPYLGELDPDSLEAPKKVTLPKSRFKLSRDPITDVPPVTPSPNPSEPPVEEPEPPVEEPVEEAEPPVEPPVEEPEPPVEPPVEESEPPVEPEPPTEPEPPVEPPLEPTTDPSEPTAPSTSAQAVASYDFDEIVRGIAADTSTEGQDNAGEIWHGAARSAGLNGYGLDMDGTGSVRIKNSADINLGTHQKRSLSLWFKADDLSLDKQVLYEEGGAGRGLNAYLDRDRLYVGGWNRPNRESDWEGTWLSTDGLQADTWNHVALVLDGDESVAPDALTAYLNGEKIGSGEGSQLWGHADKIALGNIAGRTRFHDGVGSGFKGLVGTLDEVEIFNQSLSKNQVEAIAQQA